MMLFSTQHGLLILGALIAVLVLLEWRSDRWARYRGTVTGIGVFLFNSAILSSLFIMLVTAITVAVELPRIGK
ncbi:MAG: hypothetical protein L0387_39250 [Acidobacteria bacterium]|nr:hypothetical protein [Acidobacteriota bacterium]